MAGTDGTVYREGDSDYTVTVDTYGNRADISQAVRSLPGRNIRQNGRKERMRIVRSGRKADCRIGCGDGREKPWDARTEKRQENR